MIWVSRFAMLSVWWLTLGIAYWAGRLAVLRRNELRLEALACHECHAQVQETLTHYSGCHSGWPDPSALKLPGEF